MPNIPIFLILVKNHPFMDILSNPAVIWFLIGLGLLLLELILPGLVIVFFGVGAWVTALVTAFTDINLNWQILIFLVASLLGLVLLRKYLKKRFFDRTNKEIDDQLEEFIGHKAMAIEDFEGGTGKVEFKGTLWSARSEAPVTRGDWVIIRSKDGLTFNVEKSS
jgi:membrane protein implicated in regulation of membrane protease activity